MECAGSLLPLLNTFSHLRLKKNFTASLRVFEPFVYYLEVAHRFHRLIEPCAGWFQSQVGACHDSCVKQNNA